jgi:hypothetical protein
VVVCLPGILSGHIDYGMTWLSVFANAKERKIGRRDNSSLVSESCFNHLFSFFYIPVVVISADDWFVYFLTAGATTFPSNSIAFITC